MRKTRPILFNTDMVRAILDSRKTVTRRVVKPRYCDSVFEMFRGQLCEASPDRPPRDNGDGTTTHFVRAYAPCKAPYHPGDILYVREKWRIVDYLDGLSLKFEYEADGKISDFIDFTNDRLKKFLKYIGRKGWCPKIFMPREAARIFLRVTDVRVERLQDPFFRHGSTIFSLQGEGIDIGEQCRECIETHGSPCCIDDESECGVLDDVRGVFADLWNRCYAKPRPIKGEDGDIDHYESYPWEDIQETRTYRGKPWYVIGNPWVWVIEFERISREEAMA